MVDIRLRVVGALKEGLPRPLPSPPTQAQKISPDALTFQVPGEDGPLLCHEDFRMMGDSSWFWEINPKRSPFLDGSLSTGGITAWARDGIYLGSHSEFTGRINTPALPCRLAWERDCVAPMNGGSSWVSGAMLHA